MKRVRLLVSGRVQGVFYRATCARLARQARVGGFVRNLPDGRVEAAFEGPDEEVDRLVSWCREGTELSRIDALELIPEEPVGDLSFRVSG